MIGGLPEYRPTNWRLQPDGENGYRLWRRDYGAIIDLSCGHFRDVTAAQAYIKTWRTKANRLKIGIPQT